MAYGATRGKVVLFGGDDPDTWEWNGSAWADVNPTTGSRSMRFARGMVYDAARW